MIALSIQLLSSEPSQNMYRLPQAITLRNILKIANSTIISTCEGWGKVRNGGGGDSGLMSIRVLGPKEKDCARIPNHNCQYL